MAADPEDEPTPVDPDDAVRTAFAPDDAERLLRLRERNNPGRRVSGIFPN